MAQKEILIVEDQKELMELETLLLTSRGYKVQGVPDGNAALEILADKKPDLVLLDVMLPGIDGFEVCRHIKKGEATRHIPVIMVTAKNSHDDMVRAEQVGADWYLTKPFKSAILVETVQRFLPGAMKPAFCPS